MFKVCSLTLKIGKDLIVFGISLLYIAVAILSAFFAEETFRGGFSMSTTVLMGMRGISKVHFIFELVLTLC